MAFQLHPRLQQDCIILGNLPLCQVLMIKEDKSYASPIASVFYEFYDNTDDLKIKLWEERVQLQCIVAKDFQENEIAFGQTQHPQLWDYADGVNTLAFLSKI